MTSSCSFRITRTAEDLAHAINALSQRLVELEQRQASLDSRLSEQSNEPTKEEIKLLDGVDQLLRECQELLANTSVNQMADDSPWQEEGESGSFAA